MATSLPLILLSVACGVLGQLSLKVGMGQVGQIGSEALAEPLALAMRTLTTPLFAWLLLGESVPGIRWAGVLAICVGIYLVSRS